MEAHNNYLQRNYIGNEVLLKLTAMSNRFVSRLDDSRRYGAAFTKETSWSIFGYVSRSANADSAGIISLLSNHNTATEQGFTFEVNANGKFKVVWLYGDGTSTERLFAASTLPDSYLIAYLLVYNASANTLTLCLGGHPTGETIAAGVVSGKTFNIPAGGTLRFAANRLNGAYLNGHIGPHLLFRAALTPFQGQLLARDGNLIPADLHVHNIGHFQFDRKGFSMFDFTANYNNNKGAADNPVLTNMHATLQGYDNEAVGIETDFTEKVANGGFTTASAWTAQSGWVINTTTNTADATTATSELSQTVSGLQPGLYALTYKVSRLSAGSIQAKTTQGANVAVNSTIRTDNGAYVLYVQLFSPNTSLTVAFSGIEFTGSISVVGMKKVADSGFVTQTVYCDFYTKELLKWWKTEGTPAVPMLLGGKLLDKNSGLPHIDKGLYFSGAKHLSFEYDIGNVKTGALIGFVHLENSSGISSIANFLPNGTTAADTHFWIEEGKVAFHYKAGGAYRRIRSNAALTPGVYMIQILNVDPNNSITGLKIMINGVIVPHTVELSPALNGTQLAGTFFLPGGCNSSSIGVRKYINNGSVLTDTATYFKGTIFGVGVRDDGNNPGLQRRSYKQSACGLARTDLLKCWWSPAETRDAIPDVISFQGSYIGTPFKTAPTNPSIFSIAFKFKVPATVQTQDGYFNTYFNASGVFCSVIHQSSGALVRARFTSPPGQTAAQSLHTIPGVTLTPGKELTFLFVYNGATVKIYVNGVLATTRTHTVNGVVTPLSVDTVDNTFIPNAFSSAGGSNMMMGYSCMIDAELDASQAMALFQDHTLLRTFSLITGFWGRDKVNGATINRLFYTEELVTNSSNVSATVMATTTDNLNPDHPDYAIRNINSLR